MMTPDIVLQQRLRLIDNGWRITPIRTWGTAGSGKAAFLPGWQASTATADDVTIGSNAYDWKRSPSTGIVCGPQSDGSHLLALDIDILDAAVSIELADKAAEMLGATPLLRIGRAPKRLLLYSCKHATARPAYVEGKVELLSDGAQFVAFGIHPDTGRPYEWPNGDSPEDTALADVPTTTPEKMAAWLAWVDARLTPLNGAASALGGGIEQEITVDQDGLVSDGRERLATAIVFQQFHLLEEPTLDTLADAAWQEFVQRARTDDGKWKRIHIVNKARALLRRWREGKVRHEFFKLTPTPQKPTVSIKEAQAQVTAAYALHATRTAAWNKAEAERLEKIEAAKERARKEAEEKLGHTDNAKENIRVMTRLAAEEAERLYPQVPPPVGVVRITTGGGKTDLSRPVLAQILEQAQQNAVETLVPEHTLSQELATDFASKTGHEARVRFGAERLDPRHNDGRLMCQHPELLKAARRAGVPYDLVCSPSMPGHEDCGRTWQVTNPPRAWIETSNMLYKARPREIPKPTLQVIDEAFIDNMLGGSKDLAASTFARPELDDVPRLVRGEMAAAYALADAALTQAFNDAAEAKQRFGFLPTGYFSAAGLSANQCFAVAKAEWKRKPKRPKLSGQPGEVLAQLQELEQKQRRFNPQVPHFWRLLGRALHDGHDSVVNIDMLPGAELPDGGGNTDMLRLWSRYEIHKDRQVPTLITDATARMELIREAFPQAELLVDVSIEAPHEVLVRVSGAPTKTAMERNPRTLESVRRTIEKLGVDHRTGRSDGKPDVLVICNGSKDKNRVTVERALLAGSLPPNVAVRHFGTLRGVDSFKDVSAIVIIGATRPTAAVTHLRAQRMFGRPLPKDDPLVQALAWTTTEGGQLQDIGRGRGIWRTESNPVTVYLLNDVDPSRPVAERTTWAKFQPTPAELLKARGGVLDAPEIPKGFWPVVAAALPDLFPGAEAAREAHRYFSRGESLRGYIPLRDSPRELGWLPYTVRAKAAAGGTEPGGRYAVPMLLNPAKLAELAAVFDLVPRSPPENSPEPVKAHAPAPPPPAPAHAGIVLDAVTVAACGTVATLPAGLASIGLVDEPDPWNDGDGPLSPAAVVDDPWNDDPDMLPGEALAAYLGGIMPEPVRDHVRGCWRASGLPQERIARLAGISRPQLANALQGRFGLSAHAASRLREAVAGLPALSQARLL